MDKFEKLRKQIDLIPNAAKWKPRPGERDSPVKVIDFNQKVEGSGEEQIKQFMSFIADHPDGKSSQENAQVNPSESIDAINRAISYWTNSAYGATGKPVNKNEDYSDIDLIAENISRQFKDILKAIFGKNQSGYKHIIQPTLERYVEPNFNEENPFETYKNAISLITQDYMQLYPNVNPEYVFQGTNAKQAKDWLAKGRFPYDSFQRDFNENLRNRRKIFTDRFIDHIFEQFPNKEDFRNWMISIRDEVLAEKDIISKEETENQYSDSGNSRNTFKGRLLRALQNQDNLSNAENMLTRGPFRYLLGKFEELRERIGEGDVRARELFGGNSLRKEDIDSFITEFGIIDPRKNENKNPSDFVIDFLRAIGMPENDLSPFKYYDQTRINPEFQTDNRISLLKSTPYYQNKYREFTDKLEQMVMTLTKGRTSLTSTFGKSKNLPAAQEVIDKAIETINAQLNIVTSHPEYGMGMISKSFRDTLLMKLSGNTIRNTITSIFKEISNQFKELQEIARNLEKAFKDKRIQLAGEWRTSPFVIVLQDIESLISSIGKQEENEEVDIFSEEPEMAQEQIMPDKNAFILEKIVQEADGFGPDGKDYSDKDTYYKEEPSPKMTPSPEIIPPTPEPTSGTDLNALKAEMEDTIKLLNELYDSLPEDLREDLGSGIEGMARSLNYIKGLISKEINLSSTRLNLKYAGSINLDKAMSYFDPLFGKLESIKLNRSTPKSAIKKIVDLENYLKGLRTELSKRINYLQFNEQKLESVKEVIPTQIAYINQIINSTNSPGLKTTLHQLMQNLQSLLINVNDLSKTSEDDSALVVISATEDASITNIISGVENTIKELEEYFLLLGVNAPENVGTVKIIIDKLKNEFVEGGSGFAPLSTEFNNSIKYVMDFIQSMFPKFRQTERDLGTWERILDQKLSDLGRSRDQRYQEEYAIIKRDIANRKKEIAAIVQEYEKRQAYIGQLLTSRNIPGISKPAEASVGKFLVKSQDMGFFKDLWTRGKEKWNQEFAKIKESVDGVRDIVYNDWSNNLTKISNDLIKYLDKDSEAYDWISNGVLKYLNPFVIINNIGKEKTPSAEVPSVTKTETKPTEKESPPKEVSEEVRKTIDETEIHNPKAVSIFKEQLESFLAFLKDVNDDMTVGDLKKGITKEILKGHS